MAKRAATQMDVTRNEHGHVVVSLAVTEASDFKRPVLLFRRSSEGYRAVIRDKADPAAPSLALPPPTPTAIAWLKEIPVYDKASDPYSDVAEEDDVRVEGLPYVIVCEVVGKSTENGYFARVIEVNSNA